jgi:hypothetical protein
MGVRWMKAEKCRFTLEQTGDAVRFLWVKQSKSFVVHIRCVYRIRLMSQLQYHEICTIYNTTTCIVSLICTINSIVQQLQYTECDAFYIRDYGKSISAGFWKWTHPYGNSVPHKFGYTNILRCFWFTWGIVSFSDAFKKCLLVLLWTIKPVSVELSIVFLY